jgi:serine/threonine protein kinase
MAPEQLEGRAAARTDIFALGVVLYEMATGRRAFTHHSDAGMISAILTQDPVPMVDRQPQTPLNFQFAVDVCLAKTPTTGGRAPTIWRAATLPSMPKPRPPDVAREATGELRPRSEFPKDRRTGYQSDDESGCTGRGSGDLCRTSSRPDRISIQWAATSRR